ncbi:hypothetical protein Q7P35_008537 [Cladosporium inversicolor]
MRLVNTQTATLRAKFDDDIMSNAEAWEQEEDERKALESIEDREAREDHTSRVQLSNGTRSSNGTIAGHKHHISRSSNGIGGPMTTGCVPCLIVGIPCDPNNPNCKRAISKEWGMNDENSNYDNELEEHSLSPSSSGITTMRLDTKWRRNWRERHSLNFFVEYSAPQMAGFFENTFWAKCIQYSYYEPVVLHAVSAIGSLHESILRGAFQDERTKTQAVEFALTQCNRSIAYLTGPNERPAIENGQSRGRKTLAFPKLALIACVLFTVFEAMQGHCDSAVRHALQGRALMEAHYKPTEKTVNDEEDEVEFLRTLVERLEVQAAAVLDQNDRPAVDNTSSVLPLPVVDRIYNLDHAHATLHKAMNSNMRFIQRVHPDAPADHHAITHAQKVMKYGPWYQRWEVVFSAYLAENEGRLSNMDRKRAMVLKANQLVGTMIARADQRSGPSAYYCFDEEFRAIVELSREVLTDFPCPPLPSLLMGKPYFSCSLWVTDPLWMVVSRCKDPTTRQAAFALLSQNPRQEGVWHRGPKVSSPPMRRVETGSSSLEPPGSNSPPSSREDSKNSSPGSGYTDVPLGEVPKNVSHSWEAGNMRARSEWIDLVASSRAQSTSAGSDDANG